LLVPSYCLLAIQRDSKGCYTHLWIATHIGSFLQDLFPPSWSPSHSGLCQFKLLYSLLNKEHINHIQVLGFLSFSYFSRVCSPLSVCPMSNNISAFCLCL
jgi:hypothetical protein